MMFDARSARVWIWSRPIDFRKGVNVTPLRASCSSSGPDADPLAGHLANRPFWIGAEAQRGDRYHDVKTFIGKRKIVCAAFNEMKLDVGSAGSAAGEVDHSGGGIESSGTRPFGREPRGQHAVTAADIEDSQAPRRTDHFEDQALLESIGDAAKGAAPPVGI
jgi:hypothetical protein